MISAKMIESAHASMSGAVRRTPLIRSILLEKQLSLKHPVYLKLENLQITGSFKARGAFNKLKSVQAEAQKVGVITASAGNHAQGVAYHSKALGIHAKIVMPETTPLVKVNSTRQWEPEIVLHGETYQEAYTKACEIQKKEGRIYIHAFDDEAIILGQGTIGKEILEEEATIQNLICPLGGGGLLAGCGQYFKEKVAAPKIFAVQAEGCSNFLPALQAGHPVTLTSAQTIADGIAVKRMGDITFDLCKKLVDETILVSDEEIASGILWLLENERIFAEGCGGAVIAAVMKRPDLISKPSALVVSGGNLDVNLLSRIIDRGLVRTGRLALLEVLIPDAPGSLAKLIKVFAEHKASIVQIQHERLFESKSLRDVYTTISLETHGPDHVERIKQALLQGGWQARFHR
jgi:threonine dehydratase